MKFRDMKERRGKKGKGYKFVRGRLRPGEIKNCCKLYIHRDGGYSYEKSE